jgi:hypothetical protein
VADPVFSRVEIVGEPIIISKRDRQIDLYGKLFDIGIAPGPGSAYCDLGCVFRYQQYEDKVWRSYSDTFCLRKDINHEVGRTDNLYPEQFFNSIAANFKDSKEKVTKKFISIDLTLYAGDIHFKDYQDTYINSGNLDIPPKGNINNGLGLFTILRHATKENMTLERVTHDSLCFGQYTKHLGFVRW